MKILAIIYCVVSAFIMFVLANRTLNKVAHIGYPLGYELRMEVVDSVARENPEKKTVYEKAVMDFNQQADQVLFLGTQNAMALGGLGILQLLLAILLLMKMKTEPNQSPETTPMAVTPAASHPSRQP
jgi:hypothetical protein